MGKLLIMLATILGTIGCGSWWYLIIQMFNDKKLFKTIKKENKKQKFISYGFIVFLMLIQCIGTFLIGVLWGYNIDMFIFYM